MRRVSLRNAADLRRTALIVGAGAGITGYVVTEFPAVCSRAMGLLSGMSGARGRPHARRRVVAGVVGAAAATGVGAAALTVLGGWYALRRPADHAAEVAGAAGGP